MSGGFGSVFEGECGEQSAASQLANRFGLNPEQELFDHDRNLNRHPLEPATFDMTEMLNHLGGPESQHQADNLAHNNVNPETAISHLLGEAAGGFTTPSHFPSHFTAQEMLTPLGDSIDFHFSNVTLPRHTIPFDPSVHGHILGMTDVPSQNDTWDNQLLSLSWHEATARESDQAEVPWDEARREIEQQEALSAEFWSNHVFGQTGGFTNNLEYQFRPYEFEFTVPDDEVMHDGRWAMAEGMRALAAGDVPTAVYLLETAVRADPENAEAWFQLGTAQQLNENDKAAISALGRCLTLNNKHALARVELAASFTNELRRADALLALIEWSDLHLPHDETRRQRWQAFGEYGGYTFQHNLFSEAEQRLLGILESESVSGEVTANVEAALGILYNINEEYEKAASHFERAIVCRPDDPVLYNRLGASLANGDRNADAVAAYCRALELSPGLLRTRYNLGIASCNMHAYKEAVAHFLSVLNKQADSRSSFEGVPPTRQPRSPSAETSASVWASLRMAFLAMDRRDLYDLALDQKLPELNSLQDSIPDSNNAT